jgi:hypothetical protein
MSKANSKMFVVDLSRKRASTSNSSSIPPKNSPKEFECKR